ncbi:hypothetical protein COL5a_000043 [Colletotrichum fioriniae]|nr:hypothetical protein COL5a_000043 [Colletotrichum fioriniae]
MAYLGAIALATVSEGGTAGSIVASRLAEADPTLSILIVEQGQDSFNVTNVIYPALFERNTLPDSDTALFWKANRSPQLADREPVVETGGILGGGSAINWMVYTRGQSKRITAQLPMNLLTGMMDRFMYQKERTRRLELKEAGLMGPSKQVGQR